MLTPLLALTAAWSAWAATFDPELGWRTLHTDHFNITFHEGEEQLADELSVLAEDVHDLLTVEMGHTPRRRTEVVLVDNTDVANGFAMTLPVNTIVLYATAPQEGSGLALYDDWLGTVFTHEYAHILHLDHISGLPGVARRVLGRIISVNQLSPSWIVEGSATWRETAYTMGGRGRSPQTDMILRMAALEGAFPQLGDLDGYMGSAPSGNARYLFGQSLLDHIVQQSSEDALTRWNQTYGAWVLPYVLPARAVFGRGFHGLYRSWKSSLEARYSAQRDAVMAEGLTLPTLVTRVEGSCYGPAWSPDGQHLAWSCVDRRVGPNIFVADAGGADPQVELSGRSTKDLTWRPDSQAFAYSTTHVVNDFNLYEDVYFHELGSSTATRLTNGKRARDPVFSPDGAQLVVVRNEAQDNHLAVLQIDQTLRPLTDDSDHTQLSTPAFTPDGRFLALSRWREGVRDLVVYTAAGAPYRRVTLDMDTDRDPVFTPDGRYLVFSSDRGGIANLYAVELETERLWQITNVLGGAFQPAVHPDGQTLAWQHYTAAGYQIALAPLDPSTWRDRGLLPRPLEEAGPLAALLPGAQAALPAPPADLPAPEPAGGGGTERQGTREPPPEGSLDQPAPGVGADDVAQADLVRQGDEDYPFTVPVGPYRPWGTLLPPRYVLPSLYSTGLGVMGALSTSGTDTLRRWGWSANLTYRTDSRFVGGGAAVVLNRWRPVISFGASAYTVPFGEVLVQQAPQEGANLPITASGGERYWDRRLRAYAAVSRVWRERFTVNGRLGVVQRSPQHTLPADVDTNTLPTRGVLSTVGVGLRYARAQSYAWSISPEDSQLLTLSADYTPRWLGSWAYDADGVRQPFDQLQVTGQLREYLRVPGLPNHVVALWASGGVSLGDNIRGGSFRLGGSYGDSGFYTLPEEWRPLRGFPVAVDQGDSYYLLSAEYRAPLWRVEWGPGALPFYLRTVHGAVLVDVGDAFFEPDELAPPRVGGGAELRVDTVVGWGIPLSARVGYAVALLGTGGYGPVDLGAWYFRVGSSF